jgi:xanthine dehydrogenase accessory factor
MLTHFLHDIYQKITELAGSSKGWALAVVLASRGSTPCKAGAKAVFLADGTIFGTIGGGAVEAEAGRVATEAIGTGRPVMFDFVLEGEGIGAVEPICGGAMRVLVDPASGSRGEACEAAANALRDRSRGVLITRIGGGAGLPATETGKEVGSGLSSLAIRVGVGELSVEYVREESLGRITDVDVETLRAVLGKEEPRLVSGETDAGPGGGILIEPVLPSPLLVIVGAGHVGQAVAWQAEAVGFDVVVVDDRQEYLAPERFPRGTAVRCGPMEQLADSLSLTADTYVAIVTRGHRHDAEVLAACMNKPAAYIGMIGSGRKVAQMRKEFVDSGRATAEAFDRVYAPIGLDIGAKTVPEIAASIVAQLIAVRRRGTAPRIGVS